MLTERSTEWLPVSRPMLGRFAPCHRSRHGYPSVIADDGQQNIAVTRDLRHSPLMSAIELENAVEKLPPDELDRFAAWFEQFVDSQWDDVLSADVAAGRLDAVAQKADSDFEAGRCTPL